MNVAETELLSEVCWVVFSQLCRPFFVTIFCCKRYKGKPLRPNQVFVDQPAPKDQTYEKDHFENGTWSSQYQQYNTWHGPHLCSLEFDRGTNKVTGAGNDDVGQFTVDGTFSIETHRMALTKTYQLGTGNRAENSGHQVTLQLTWNGTTNQFEGKWYVQTNKYQGNGDFQLKFKDHTMINFEKITSWHRSAISSVYPLNKRELIEILIAMIGALRYFLQ